MAVGPRGRDALRLRSLELADHGVKLALGDASLGAPGLHAVAEEDEGGISVDMVFGLQLGALVAVHLNELGGAFQLAGGGTHARCLLDATRVGGEVEHHQRGLVFVYLV